MPSVRINGVNLHYIENGTGPETIVFAHGLIMDSESFREQVRAFAGPRYRVVAYDHRGHGRSEAALDYRMDTLADDAAGLIEHLGGPVHFCGLSMGGFVGLRLGIRRPELLRSLILMSTNAEALTGAARARRVATARLVRYLGFGPLAKRIVPFMYGATYLGSSANEDFAFEYVRQLPRGLWRPMLAVAERDGVAEELPRIVAPTLVVAGEEDTLTTPDHSERIVAAIPNATFVRLPRTGHLITDENPAAATSTIASFLDTLYPRRAQAKALERMAG